MPRHRGGTRPGDARDRRDRPHTAATPSSSGPESAIGHAHGWALFAHPCVLDQLERLVTEVESGQQRHPTHPPTSANAKVLAAIVSLIFDRIPQDPTRTEYRQGDTFGSQRKHWFRAKFGNGRFRLFFRYRSDARLIVYAWVNDQETLRPYGSRTDPYAVFARMLDAGNPPDDWDELLAAATSPKATDKRGRIVKRLRR